MKISCPRKLLDLHAHILFEMFHPACFGGDIHVAPRLVDKGVELRFVENKSMPVLFAGAHKAELLLFGQFAD